MSGNHSPTSGKDPIKIKSLTGRCGSWLITSYSSFSFFSMTIFWLAWKNQSSTLGIIFLNEFFTFLVDAVLLTTRTGVRWSSRNHSLTFGSNKVTSLTGCWESEGLLLSFLSLSSLSLRFCSLSARAFALLGFSVIVVVVIAVVVELPSSGFFSPSLGPFGWDGFLRASALALVCWMLWRYVVNCRVICLLCFKNVGEWKCCLAVPEILLSVSACSLLGPAMKRYQCKANPTVVGTRTRTVHPPDTHVCKNKNKILLITLQFKYYKMKT